MMQVVDFPQGSPEWLAHRRNYFNASDAPAMMGCSPYKSRQQLIKELATGIVPEVDAATQARFDEGHRIEALARPLAEKFIGEDLYPVTGVNGRLGASFDGLTMDWRIAFEHKTLNDELRAAIPEDPYPLSSAVGARLPLLYRIQMQQQLDVSGAEADLFGATKWIGDECVEQRWCWYHSDPALSAEIAAGWAQLEKDVAAYKPEAVAEPVVAAPIETLPAVAVKVSGSLAIQSNLDVFGDMLKEFVAGIVMQPSTDQEFADAEAAVKALQRAEDALAAAQSNALAQVQDVELLTRAIANLSDAARTARLALSKSVEKRKEQIRTEIVMEGKKALADHVAAINADFPKQYLQAPAADFAAAIKGKRTVETLRSAMQDCLAKAKIEADTAAERIRSNLAILVSLASDHKQLFPDTGVIVLKAPDDLTALVKSRIAEHEAAEAAKRKAEQERIERETRERVEREERERIAAEERAKLAAEQEAAKTVSAPAPVAQVQACRPAGREMLKTPAGAEMAAKAVAAIAKAPTLIELVTIIAAHYNVSIAVATDWLAEAIKQNSGAKQ